jgi:very-short-patch-repair endonuclease
VNKDLATLLAAQDGVACRAAVLAVVPHHVIDYAARKGQVVRLFPRIYVDPLRLAEPWTRMRAALYYAGSGATLSHITALGVWCLPGGDLDGPAHVMVPAGRRPRATDGIVVHRRRGFDADGSTVLRRRGVPVCRVERCVVDSWRLLPTDTGRAAVIGSVSERLTTPGRLLSVIDSNPNLPRRFELVRLVHLLAKGCRSELELWGHDRIFVGPDLPRFERNVRMRVGGRSIYLDVYCPEAKVNFELDGARWHSSPAARERDRRRDAALAALGIMVVRFTHDQLVHTPDLVRRQVRAIVAARLAGVTG